MGRAGFSGRAIPAKKTTQLLAKAQILLARHGVWTVFLSRWLLSPMGPYVNLICGATRSIWWRFSLSSLAGESLWGAVSWRGLRLCRACRGDRR
ncbi:VTT domain-containing protein [Paracoccus litorisediminis]|uniref:hypothetical protein n=1 Tax=Paracoccus litorisediminis TaxID=2006130 RepID=UPI00372DE0CE